MINNDFSGCPQACPAGKTTTGGPSSHLVRALTDPDKWCKSAAIIVFSNINSATNSVASVGTLKTALTGVTTSVVVTAVGGIDFVTTTDLIIGGSTVPFANVYAVTFVVYLITTSTNTIKLTIDFLHFLITKGFGRRWRCGAESSEHMVLPKCFERKVLGDYSSSSLPPDEKFSKPSNPPPPSAISSSFQKVSA